MNNITFRYGVEVFREDVKSIHRVGKASGISTLPKRMKQGLLLKWE
jgi:hypothetical protein